MIDFECLDSENTTVEEAEEHAQWVDMVTYMILEGFIEVEVGEDDQPRLYPVGE